MLRKSPRRFVVLPLTFLSLATSSLAISGCVGDLFHDTEWHTAYCSRKTPEQHECVLDDEFGIFVRPNGDDNGFGTSDEPVRTIGRAISLAAASGRHVFACAGTYDEPVTLPAGVHLFGGLDCQNDDWTWTSASSRSVIRAPAGKIPITIEPGETRTRVENINAEAVDGEAPGDSAIALLADHANASLRNVTLKAGKGATGTTGKKPSGVSPSGLPGEAGADACLPNANYSAGGQEVVLECPGGSLSRGGAGGDGNFNKGAYGAAGSDPGGAMGAPTDLNSSTYCTRGGPGDRGADGMPGLGATGLGALTKTGYIGVSGGAGTKGSNGGGGGGGGGGAALTCAGGGGGSGGTGGCGGTGGNGGGPGGASIGLVSLDAKISFRNVTISTSDGGAGGEGGPGVTGGGGGEGGKGGTHTDTSRKGCDGGAGGNGGTGGGGGGGLGGHSVGVAYTGRKVDISGVHVTIGTGGGGGNAKLTGPTRGQAGVSEKVFNFDPPK